MPNNHEFTVAIDRLLVQLEKSGDLGVGIEIANQIIGLLGSSQIVEKDLIIDEHLLQLPNAERYDSWFQGHPWMKGERAVFEVTDAKDIPIQGKFYWLQKRSRQFIAGSVHFTENWEDADYTRNDNFKIGIDFFLAPNGKSLSVALSSKGNIRIVELQHRLNNTQVDIFSKWHNAVQISSREALHNTLWESFKLQSVNKEFYTGISNSFTELLQHLKGIGRDEEDAKLFANRLLGRLLFVWFLRKKNIIDESMRYFNAQTTDSTAYYKQSLEPLFFNTLNTPINDRDELKNEVQKRLFPEIDEQKHKELFQVDSKTPYLNGGLFEPHTNDWYKDSSLTLPEGFFTNLYDHFDKFNFTTDESTPEYEQVAIDPEMLGRVFESLLATQVDETGKQARKAKGAFYTPREIVSYMCRESLRNYLYDKQENDERYKKSIDELLDRTDHEWAGAGTNSRRDAVPKEYRAVIVKALDSVTILDPACGSGAFPMGILQLLIKIYERLESRFDSYEKKLQIVQNNIFGVDIEPMAVEISRLRTWLSLIVDEEDSRNVAPLPNLDFKFVCANSLIPLDDDNSDLFNDPELHKELAEIRQTYFNARKPHTKKAAQAKYYKLTRSNPDLFENLRTKQLKSFDPFINSYPAEFFDADQMFGISNGFDVIIGNPPYVRQELFTDTKPILRLVYGCFFNGRADLYTYFIKLGFKLLKVGGVFSYITSNKFFVRGYGENTRRFLTNECSVKQIVNFGELPVFQASVDSAIIVATNTRPGLSNKTKYAQVKKSEDIFDLYNFLGQSNSEISSALLGAGEWSLQDPEKLAVLSKIRNFSNTLSTFYDGKIYAGIKTGCDEAFVIDSNTKLELEIQWPDSSKVIKPWLRGRDVKRWRAAYKDLYVIYIPLDEPIDKYPGIKAHLLQYKEKLEKRAVVQDWMRMQQPQERFTTLFDIPKMVYPDCAKDMRVLYDKTGAYGTMAMYFIPYNPTVMGILNSRLFDWYARMTFATFGDPWKEGRIIFKTLYMSRFPLPEIENYTSKDIASLVESVLSSNLTEKAIKDIENRINELVYTLYGLNSKDIGTIENSYKCLI